MLLIRLLMIAGLLGVSLRVLRAQTPPDSTAGRGSKAVQLPPDTVRVNQLIERADRIGPHDYVQAIQLGQEALTLARTLHYTAGEASALLVVGSALSERNDYASALQFLEQARQRFARLHNRVGVARVIGRAGWINTQKGDYVPALSLGLQSLSMAKALNDSAQIRREMSRLGSLYNLLGDYSLALLYSTTALDLFEKAHQEAGVSEVLNGIGELYRAQGDLTKATRYYNKAIRLAGSLGDVGLRAGAESNLAAVQLQQGHYSQALGTGHRALRVALSQGKYEMVVWTQTVLAHAHLDTSQPDSAVYYGQQAWRLSRQIGAKEASRAAGDVLAQAYARQKNFALAYTFQRACSAYTDTLSGRQTQQQLALLQHDAALAEQQTATVLRNEEARRQQQLLLSALVGLGLLGVVAGILWRSNRQQQRTNAQLRRQQAEIQAAQTQLVQREKMASLGELTAGIAHEIQNPLNFVNNFAEVSVELVDELNDEVAAGHTDADDMLPLTGDLRQNLTRIHHHGKRADAIVKAMLQHSRSSTGERQLTDLNALADEYLRLSYHGMRWSEGRTPPGNPAKDKDGATGRFNAELLTRFDPDLGKVSVVGQDIGRVLLNLFNNAFYAVLEKKKQLDAGGAASSTEPVGYEPQVSVSTRKVNDTVEIRVRDNGNGIPDAVLEKIYQPFFTTKPTGEGTGLGLSLSYDIITKGHSGTLTVTTKPGEFSEFVVTLPLRVEIAVS